MMERTHVWPLTQSQILALEAVEEKITAFQHERERRAGIIFHELATQHQQDATTLQGTLQVMEGRPVFLVQPLVEELRPDEITSDGKKSKEAKEYRGMG